MRVTFLLRYVHYAVLSLQCSSQRGPPSFVIASVQICKDGTRVASRIKPRAFILVPSARVRMCILLLALPGCLVPNDDVKSLRLQIPRVDTGLQVPVVNWKKFLLKCLLIWIKARKDRLNLCQYYGLYLGNLVPNDRNQCLGNFAS